MPYTTVQKRLLGVTQIQNIILSAEPGMPLDALSARIAETLRARHAIGAGEDDDFMVRTLEEMATVLTSTTTSMRWLSASVRRSHSWSRPSSSAWPAALNPIDALRYE